MRRAGGGCIEGAATGARSSGRRDEQHHDLSDLLKKAENVAGVAADLPARKHRGERDGAAGQQQGDCAGPRSERSQRNDGAEQRSGKRDGRLGRPAAAPSPSARAGRSRNIIGGKAERDAAWAAISASPAKTGSRIAAIAVARNPMLSTSATTPKVP